MKTISAWCALAVLLLPLCTTAARSQDPVKVAPELYKVRLNNDAVRVLEYSSKPGQKEPMHSHPDYLVYVIQGGKIKTTTSDGQSKETEYKVGDVIWREAVTHSGENIGTTEVKTLLIELKHGKKK